MTEDLLRRHVARVLAVGPGVPDDYELDDNLLVAVDGHRWTALLDVAKAWLKTFGGTVELFEAMTRCLLRLRSRQVPSCKPREQAIPSALVSVVESHDPVRAILDTAARSGSVVAVSSHVRTGIQRAVLGSVAGELLRFCSTPVSSCRGDVGLSERPRSAAGEPRS